MSRSKAVLLLGFGTYVAAWALGSQPLYPLAIGLVAAGVGARVWGRLADSPMRLRRTAGRGVTYEGDDVWVTLELERSSRAPLGSAIVREQLGRLGDRETRLRRDRRAFRATYVLENVPRGRYAVADAEVALEDPLGLERFATTVPASGALVVYPRLVVLDVLFSESGALLRDGRRLLLRRPSGFDLHSVRAYEQGESLRKVHWPTTARRGQLMVKELEDAPRDEVAVLLDARGATVGGGFDTSFDAQVRAAGSILQSHAARGRRAVLAVNSARRESIHVASLGGDWQAALEVLAAVIPDGTRPLDELLSREGGPAARALEVVVVTATLGPELVNALLRRRSRLGVSVVWIDAASYAGRPITRESNLLRLGAAGVPVAVVRRGIDLAQALSARSRVTAAHG